MPIARQMHLFWKALSCELANNSYTHKPCLPDQPQWENLQQKLDHNLFNLCLPSTLVVRWTLWGTRPPPCSPQGGNVCCCQTNLTPLCVHRRQPRHQCQPNHVVDKRVTPDPQPQCCEPFHLSHGFVDSGLDWTHVGMQTWQTLGSDNVYLA